MYASAQAIASQEQNYPPRVMYVHKMRIFSRGALSKSQSWSQPAAGDPGYAADTGFADEGAWRRG
jgi:hypothetical protein